MHSYGCFYDHIEVAMRRQLYAEVNVVLQPGTPEEEKSAHLAGREAFIKITEISRSFPEMDFIQTTRLLLHLC